MNTLGWYYRLGDEVIGPLTPPQLKQAVTQGSITPDTLVRQENRDWQVASNINGLAQLLSPQPQSEDAQSENTQSVAVKADVPPAPPAVPHEDTWDVIDSASDGSMTIEVLAYRNLGGSRDPSTAANLFFASQAGLRLKQVRITLENSNAITEAGALHYLQGRLETTSNVGGMAGLGKAFLKNLTAQESIFTPRYEGSGQLYLEPSFGFYMIYPLSNEEIIADKGLFYCGSGDLKVGVAAQKNISSALLGGEGFFQVSVQGRGLCVFEIPVPVNELRRVDLKNDVLKVDGNFAIMRTGRLNFTVERSTKGLLGSVTSGEGLLQTFRGTGTVWLAPTQAIYQRIRMGGLSGMTSAQRSSGTVT
ncbi:MAG: AIM24 family protein [Elainellaceae cyanobacterium]